MNRKKLLVGILFAGFSNKALIYYYEEITRVNNIQQNGYFDIIGWPDALKYFNKEELSIFRNYIFKRNGYHFKNNRWVDFFTRYNNYDVTRNINTEQAAMNQMSETEKWLLEQIIKEEK
jgi:hypothetical protein